MPPESIVYSRDVLIPWFGITSGSSPGAGICFTVIEVVPVHASAQAAIVTVTDILLYVHLSLPKQ
jgi:hypothetical protein